MASKTSDASDAAMKGGGYYSLSTAGAKHVIDHATPLVLGAIKAMRPERRRGAFAMADMGCADGGTSIDMVRAALQAVRARAPQRDILMLYTDQPRNDYNALFQNVYGSGGLDALDRVYLCASATSFYRQVLPADSVDLGFSATAMHWLSRKPGNISGHVHAVGAAGPELAAFTVQGREDWRTILLHRARELVSGGRLVLVNFCRDEQGRYLGNTGGVNMFDAFNRIWQSFLDDGAIGRDEYANMTLPQYYNRVEEFSAPLIDPTGAVHRAGLRLKRIETGIVPCPYAAEFRRHGDAAAFAKAYIPTLRSWSESTYFGALSSGRPLEERQAIIERFYGAYETMVRDNPQDHAMDYVHAYMTIAKV